MVQILAPKKEVAPPKPKAKAKPKKPAAEADARTTENPE
jgi:hypothetical protein